MGEAKADMSGSYLAVFSFAIVMVVLPLFFDSNIFNPVVAQAPPSAVSGSEPKDLSLLNARGGPTKAAD